MVVVEPPMPPQDIRERTFRFACAIARCCRGLGDEGAVNRHLAAQLLRAGTSIGANLEEAKAAYSRREFVMKCAIALKEARETLYWLRLAAACNAAHPTLAPLQSECNELVAILTAIVRTARSRPPRRSSPDDGKPSFS